MHADTAANRKCILSHHLQKVMLTPNCKRIYGPKGEGLINTQGSAAGKGNIVYGNKLMLKVFINMNFYDVMVYRNHTYVCRVQTAFHVLSIFYEWFQHLNTNGP